MIVKVALFEWLSRLLTYMFYCRSLKSMAQMADGITCMAFTVSFVPNTGNKYFLAAADENLRLYDFEKETVRRCLLSEIILLSASLSANLYLSASLLPDTANLREHVLVVLRLW